MILSRLPVRQVYRHLLPYPCDPGVPGMPRIAVEAVVGSAVRRRARHHDAPRVLFGERSAWRRSMRCARSTPRAMRTRAMRGSTMTDGGPFQTFVRPRATHHHRRLQFRARLGRASPHARAVRRRHARAASTRGTWPIPGAAHPSTFKIYEKKTPDEPELHCDFIFVGDELRTRVARDPRRSRDAGVRPSARGPDARVTPATALDR